MAIEDFTTYTELDTGTNITVTSSKVNHDYEHDKTEWLYSDKGIDHFTNWEHLCEVYMTSHSNNRLRDYWALTNHLEDHETLRSNGRDALTLLCGNVGGAYRIYAMEIDGGVHDGDYFTGAVATLYYLTIEKSTTTFTVKIYSDAARTVLLDTLTVTINDNNYRYVFGTLSRNQGAGGQYSKGYTQNLDLQEVAVSSIDNTKYHRHQHFKGGFH